MQKDSVGNTGSLILDSLVPVEFQRFSPDLEKVELSYGEVICEAEEQIRHVYFPVSSLVSIVSILSDGSYIEVSLVGREGMVGLPVILGTNALPNRRAVVLIPGSAYRLNVPILRREFARAAALHDALLRSAHAYLTQIAQSVVCSCSHLVKERLARWLLTCCDKLAVSDLHITHEAISIMLGKRRAGITVAARALQKEGLIECGRRRIRIVDPKGLERSACECYGVVKAEFNRLQSDLLSMRSAPERVGADDNGFPETAGRGTVGDRLLAFTAASSGARP